MNRLLRGLAVLTFSSLVSVPALAGPADDRTAASMAVDVAVARPLGVVVTAAGTGLFLVSLPFSLLGGNVVEAADALVVKPAGETFVRCLGCASNGRYNKRAD